MKIAQVVAVYPPHPGGMGQVVYEETQRLQKLGHTVVVFALNTVPSLRWGDAGFLPTLFWRLRKFDLVHLHYPFYGSAQCVFLARKIWGVKYVVTYHMDARPEGVLKKIFQSIYDAIWARIILRNADKVIMVDKASFAESRYANVVPDNKRVEIVNGVDINLFAPRQVSGEQLGLQDWQDKKIALFVGNTFPLKRLDLLLLAAARLKQTDLRLLVVGGGYDLAQYRILAKELGIADLVRFVGVCQDRGKLIQYYNISWCLVVPSATETFSLVALEALACGVPVLISGRARERVADGVDGMIFLPDNDADLAEKLRRMLMLSPLDRGKMGAVGREKVSQLYTWDEHLRKLLAAYGL